MKRILLSLMIVALASSTAIGATRAYFSSGQVLGTNTFATGNVKINNMSVVGAPFTFSNLGPGISETKRVYFQYTGTLNTDIYMGAGGTTNTDSNKYMADHLNIVIRDHNNGSWVWGGTAQELSTVWKNIASNVNPNGWLDYDVTFTLDPTTGNTHQGVSNTDTVIMLYSVQHGSVAPTSKPYTSFDGSGIYASF